MRTARELINKVGFTAIGVGTGLILAAGSGFAAVQLSRTAADDHSIDVVQSSASHSASAAKEDSSVSGVDDRLGAVERETEPELGDDKDSKPELGDDKDSKPAATDNSGRSSHDDGAARRSPEPGDDRGQGISPQPGDDRGRGGNH